ncbi:MAG: AAA family ATPase [Planctomycetes bacterium]|nr:AAA family ATPase [Planctomycetota bacterium]
MNINSIQLHNFRSLIDGTFTLNDYAVIVGKNNSGKTSIIDSVRAFYEKDKFKYKKDRDFPFSGSSDNDSWIEISYSLTKDEFESLPDDYHFKVNSLTVRKWFQGAIGGRKDGEIYAYLKGGELSKSPFHGAPGVGKGKLGNVIYIPAVSKVEDHTKLTGPSALRDLIQDILRSLAKSQDSFSVLQSTFTELSRSLKMEKDSAGRSLIEVENDITESLESWGATFSLSIEPPTEDQILKNLVSHSILESQSGRSLDSGQLGSGFQRHLIYSLIKLQARYTKTEKKTKKKQFSPDMTLVLFEEPEAFLHPPQQRMLHHELRDLSSDGEHQVLCSSHSPHFLCNKLDELSMLIRLQKDEGLTECFQLNKKAIEKIADESTVLKKIIDSTDESEIDPIDPMDESIFYFIQLDPRRASMFYCDHVVLVEGPSERVLIEWLRDNNKLNLGNMTLEVIDCIGKFNIHRFMLLCKHLGIRHSIIFDDDNNKPKQVPYNNFLNELAPNTGCENVLEIKSDIESFLGLPSQSRNKPMEMLKAIVDESIGTTSLNNIAAMVRANIGTA